MLLLAWLATAAAGFAATLEDQFANRQTVTDPAGEINGNNAGATVETGEPRHVGKPGGHSMWISWVAPADGVATFRTDGSTFDTLLAAYYFETPADTTFDKLHVVARNDDRTGLAPASLIQFGARAGRHYEIAVDGFAGANGDIRLRWDFVDASTPPPILVNVPGDQAVVQGAPVTLTIDMVTTPELKVEWEFNGEEINTPGLTLFIPSFQPANVGRYELEVSIGGVKFETPAIELQINSEGLTNTLARDKMLESPDSPLIGEDDRDDHGGGKARLIAPRVTPKTPPIGVVRGYNGGQIFSTVFATTDPNEPPHCGVTGGASYWLLYQPPANGTLALDTIGSGYDTVMEAYTFTGALRGYGGLISLACDNDGVAPQGSARMAFPVFKSRQYVVVVDGVNGARGIAALNYSLDTNQPPEAPALMEPVQPVFAAPGDTVRLAPAVKGSPPLHFAWTKDGRPMDIAGRSLVFTNVDLSHAGTYALTVTNEMGNLTSEIQLHVVVAPRCEAIPASGGFSLQFASVTGLLYFIEEAPSAVGPWQAWPGPMIGDGLRMVVALPTGESRFFRLRVE